MPPSSQPARTSRSSMNDLVGHHQISRLARVRDRIRIGVQSLFWNIVPKIYSHHQQQLLSTIPILFELLTEHSLLEDHSRQPPDIVPFFLNTTINTRQAEPKQPPLLQTQAPPTTSTHTHTTSPHPIKRAKPAVSPRISPPLCPARKKKKKQEAQATPRHPHTTTEPRLKRSQDKNHAPLDQNQSKEEKAGSLFVVVEKTSKEKEEEKNVKPTSTHRRNTPQQQTARLVPTRALLRRR
ncbi:hypothetical protein EJ03DRAFT_30294 [Teratosphaeria nubilosa]|uniref:Uncharacterized protein n=1 Tax=Teratosphaeria nubilosa TaxID=161662 RepID=A0A6G1LF56_9PEZI|nr:hypothetical protein EJ03DRAFT_30294 [Teratosphaeria nubilosa]